LFDNSLITIRRRRKEWDLPSVAKQGQMISAQELDTICKHERKKFPRLGGVGMKRQVKEEFGWNISKFVSFISGDFTPCSTCTFSEQSTLLGFNKMSQGQLDNDRQQPDFGEGYFLLPELIT
jgi:hypothetical protein